MSNGNELAYPHAEKDDCNNHFGLTKREAFAMAAMQGILADSSRSGSPEACALAAIVIADALLAELDK